MRGIRPLVIPSHEEWMDQVRPGDILLENGQPRVVRAVKAVRGYNQYFTFTILRCSWTRSCYTVLNRSDLRTRGFEPTGQRKQSMDLLDKRIAAECARPGRDAEKRRLFCWDVREVERR